MKPSLFSLTVLLTLFCAAPASFAQGTMTPATATEEVVQNDILTTLTDRGDFTILVDALRSTGLDEALASGETFTLFAPTDAAFQKLPAGTLESLTPEQLTGILRYHVLVGAVPSQDAAALDTAPSVQGSDLTLATTDAGLTVNDATITEADVQASNGVIHVIDAVLVPEAAPMEDEHMEEKEDSMDKEMMDDGSGEPAPAPEKITPTDDQR